MIFRAEVYNTDQLEQALNNPHIDCIYAPYSIIDEKYHSFNKRIILIPPLYLSNCEEKIKEKFLQLKESGFNSVLVHTIGHIELFSGLGYGMHGGYRLNCLNNDSILFFREHGIKDIIISPEISVSQLDRLDGSDVGFIAYGKLPLMITRRCPVKNGAPCDKKCCNKIITDRKGNKLNIICNENTAEILNSDVLYLADKINSFRKASFAVLKFTTEQDINQIVESYINSSSPEIKKFTRGLYFRGIKE